MHRTIKRALLAATACGAIASTPVFAGAANPGAYIGRADAARPVAFDVILPLRDIAGLESVLIKQQDRASPSFHHWLTPVDFARRFGPGQAVLDRAAASLRARGFTVTVQSRSLHAVGAASDAEAMLGTHLMLVAGEAGRNRIVNDSALRLPAELSSLGAAIYSFSPHAAHLFSHQVTPLQAGGVANRNSPTGAYWYNDLKQAYSYPSLQATIMVKGQSIPLDGTGATIGVLMSSDVNDSDIKAMFDHENWSATTGKPDPTLFQRVAINGGGGLKGGALAEASLDTQQALGGAPGAHVVLYNIPDLSDGNIFAGYVTIVEQNLVDAVSSSFGGCELAYFPAYNNGQDYRGLLKSLHELFEQGNAQGITFLASSGDEAGLECPDLAYLDGGNGSFVKSVSEPADDPDVTAVGGTNLVTAYTPGSLDSTYASENAWEDPLTPGDPYQTGGLLSGGVFGAGGGYSQMWRQPSYQAGFATGSTSRRAMPDIGMEVGGCPYGAILNNAGVCDGGDTKKNGAGNIQRSAAEVAINVGKPKGGFGGYVGTSIASPEFLSTVALLIEEDGSRVGNINPRIYAVAKGQAAGGPEFFHVSIPGYNGVRNTVVSPEFSLSTGVGTPIVNTFLSLTGVPVAGVPQTPTNP